jgi:hypothetical protein
LRFSLELQSPDIFLSSLFSFILIFADDTGGRCGLSWPHKSKNTGER